jgi:hypothetical protein
MIEISRPHPIDWSPGFSQTQKKPYGSYIVFQIMEQIFPQSKIRISERSIYNTVYNFPSDSSTIYLFINDVFDLSKFEFNKLIYFVEEGNTAFLSANIFHGALADCLNILSDFQISYQDTSEINLVNPELKREKNYKLKPNEAPFYFSKFDTANTTVLGRNKYNQVNYIKIKMGKGNFYLSSVPIVYTNYYLLYMDIAEYISGSFSYLEPDIIIWDEYYKKNKETIKTPLRFILSNTSLSWAYYLLISFFVLFIFFKSKRMQRIIPVFSPLKNTSMEFVSIIGKLYFRTKDHTGIAKKRIVHLLDTTKISNEFLNKLAGKSGVSKMFLEELFGLIHQVNQRDRMTEKELVIINHQIDQFYKRVEL